MIQIEITQFTKKNFFITLNESIQRSFTLLLLGNMGIGS